MRWVGLAGIRLYQRTLSRWTPRCPEPESCSEYAIRMINGYGLRRGLEMALERIERCGLNLHES